MWEACGRHVGGMWEAYGCRDDLRPPFQRQSDHKASTHTFCMLASCNTTLRLPLLPTLSRTSKGDGAWTPQQPTSSGWGWTLAVVVGGSAEVPLSADPHL